jgi:mitogen-activated protein kinase 1/3
MESNQVFHGKYETKEKLGEGAFGAVFKVLNRETQQLQALKIIQVPKQAIYFLRTLREILLLRYLRHEHLILLEDAFMIYVENNIYVGFVTKLMKMNMRKLVEDYYLTMSCEHIKFFMYQLFLGLDYLHYNGILHRDLKPDNILVNNLNYLQIADFGWARVIPRNQEDFTKEFANIYYRAPEICLMVDEMGPPVDIWAVGCVFFEILEKRTLFSSHQNGHLVKEIIQKFGSPSNEEIKFVTNPKMRDYINNIGNFEKRNPSDYLTTQLDSAGRDLLNQCLHFDPNKRISTSEALKHPYFSELYEANEVNAALNMDAANIDFTFEEIPYCNDKVYLLNRIVTELNFFKKPL